ncbi:MAG TPA: hypothetical protein VM598_05375 [Bdellovibrionota bacterium]|nr:hypothetical protein [Bdellovibrionota bacterium]
MNQRTGNSRGGEGTDSSQVIDFAAVREQKLEEKRKSTERILFRHLLSVFSVVGDSTMCPIELIDVSEEGCSFQIPFNPKKPWPSDMSDIPLRLYFSQDTFLEIHAKIQNSSPSIENGTRYTRFGCRIDQTRSSFVAFQQFVRFLKSYSQLAQKDSGDITVFYL